jgi:iron complex transport system substrate-binding protein
MKRFAKKILSVTAIGLLAASFCSLMPLRLAGQDQRTITDNLSRTITIPAKVGRVLSLQSEITRLIVALGAADSLVGIDYFLRTNDRLFRIVYPLQVQLPLTSMADYNVNLETLTRLNPDIIFGAPEDRQVCESLQAKIKVPVVALASMGRFDRLLEEMKLLGDILNRKEKAAELATYFKEIIAGIQNIVLDEPGAKKPRVYLTFYGALNRTPVFYEPVNAAGGINLAQNLLPSSLGVDKTVVDVEQVIKWNPDFILIHGNYPPRERIVTVENVLRDPRLAAVAAVKNKKVYYTFGFWNWWDMGQVLVETLYLAKLFYPDKFAGVQIDKEGNRIFKKIYGVDSLYSSLSKFLKCDEWAHE